MQTRSLLDTVSIETAGCATHQQVQHEYCTLLERHLFHGTYRTQPKLQVADPAGLVVHARSGMLGKLGYCHLNMTPHTYIDDNTPPPGPLRHMVVVQLSGTSTFISNANEVRLRPGELMLMHDTGRLRVEHETQVEQIALLDPLAADDLRQFKRRHLHRHCSRSDLDRMVVRWVRDACVDARLDSFDASHDVARALSRLLAHLLCGGNGSATAEAPAALTRGLIEDYIACRLEDTELSPTRIAEAFGCSVRTLHRSFARDGNESLERHLWQMRIEACARELRNEAEAAATTLTDLALRFGFKSSTHFSGLFRQLHGITPSAYRRLHHTR